MKHKLFRLLVWPSRLVVFGVCGFISMYVLLSGYESIYNRYLPFVHTLDKVNLSAFTPVYNLDAAMQQNSKYYGDFGKPVTLKLPQRSIRLDVVPPLRESSSGVWLARSTTMHLLIPKPPRSGNIGVVLLYCRSSFRTISSQNLPTVGENVFMDTDQSWRYVYKVVSSKIYPDSEPYIASDDGVQGKLLIDCNDASKHLNVIVEGSLLAAQGVTQ